MQHIRWRDIDQETPTDGQEVLLSFEGAFHVATYKKSEHSFYCGEAEKFMLVNVKYFG
jgi:hypothetical protein